MNKLILHIDSDELAMLSDATRAQLDLSIRKALGEIDQVKAAREAAKAQARRDAQRDAAAAVLASFIVFGPKLACAGCPKAQGFALAADRPDDKLSGVVIRF